MLVLPVIDLKNGIVVHGRAGQRESYAPVNSALCGDARPASIAHAFANELGFQDGYVADLDAIAGECPDWSSYRRILEHLPSLWIDAGMADVARAQQLLWWGPEGLNFVCGLESLCSVTALREMLQLIGPDRMVLSLDLFHGRTCSRISAWNGVCPKSVAKEVLRLGVRRMIVLDVSRVGMNGGTGTRELTASIRQGHPNAQIVAGGGVSSVEQICQLQQDGCDGVLVASALHDGRLNRTRLDELSSNFRECTSGR